MFISRSKHEQEVAKLQQENKDRLDNLLRCNLDRVQAETQVEYLQREIEIYKAQIEDLKKLVFISREPSSPEILEADAIISADDKPVGITDEEHHAYLESQRERDLIFGGGYDTELFNR